MNHPLKKIYALWACGILACCVTLSAQSQRKIQFNDAWKFSLSDTPEASQSDFNDADWRTLNLPHDWSIEGTVSSNYPSGNDGGYYPTGIGWYRKTLHLSTIPADTRISLYFEGVYMNAEIFVNGKSLGIHPYGYTSFSHDLTPYLHEGDNLIAVKVDNSRQKNCRWYSGSGIYRNVWLVTTPAVHFTQWGTFISSTLTGKTEATVTIQTTVTNESDHSCQFQVNTRLTRQGHPAGHPQQEPVILDAGETRRIKQQITLSDVRCWSLESPELYEAHLSIDESGKRGDRITETFGIREISYSPDKGLLLNGKPLVLNGGCLHHDNGCLGAAAYRDAEWRKVRLMKEAGFNAVRTSHNPPSEEFLHACDRLGLLVIDEAFDGWRDSKTPHDYSVHLDHWWTRDLDAMVLRDRNHPSVFCWSIGNEIIERKKPEAVLTAHAFAGYIRKLDPTRPVTSALTTWDNTWDIYDPLAAAHDIAGYNYQLHRAESDHKRVPSRIIMQTESYPRDAFANWACVNRNTYVIGDFVWTALDYLGESGIGRYYYKGETEGEHYQRDQYPWHGAYCGDIDLTGFRKPISHYRELLYNPDKKLYMAVKEPNGYYGEIKETQWSVWPAWERWNWPGHEGKDIQVDIYSRYPAVRLYLNDRLVGEQSTSPEQAFKAVFTLPYEPGVLRATGVADGKETECAVIETAGTPTRITLATDRTQVNADGESLVYVTATITDKQGRPVPDSNHELTFETQGVGRVIATCSANLQDSIPATSATRQTWHGRALAVIKAGREKEKIKLTVKGKSLSKASVEIEVN
ncbi:MAG: DUF4982 domain-containing protein [Paraprevotella sp.]|nr:DUF4982 domain-containing protein [Paraprevotella sp.]